MQKISLCPASNLADFPFHTQKRKNIIFIIENIKKYRKCPALHRKNFFCRERKKNSENR